MGLYKKLKKIISDSGAALIEFAILAPILITILLGIFDLGNYIYAVNKVGRLASSVNDITGRNQMKDCELQSLLDSTPMFVEPFDFASRGSIIVTGVADINDGNGARVKWRKSAYGAKSSKIGAVGAVPVLPAGFTISPGDSAVFVEVYYNFDTLFKILNFNTKEIYRMIVTKPRLGQMVTLTPC